MTLMRRLLPVLAVLLAATSFVLPAASQQIKISELPVASAANDADLTIVAQGVAPAPITTRSATVAQVRAGLATSAQLTAGLAGKQDALSFTGTGPAVLSSSPTLGGQALIQGLTTTQPGWYAQLTGDTFPRVRIGLNATDIASLALGSGSAARDVLLERAGPANLRLGSSDAASPVAQTISVQNVVAGTTNTAGANLAIDGSQGTGTGVSGSILFKVAPAGSSGSAQNPLTTALTIDSTKLATFTGAITGPSLTLTTTPLAASSGGTGVTTSTGSGSVVLSTSPALTTPNLGTPSAITLTSATGLPVSTGISGFGTGVAAFLATPSSANLASALTDETGTGAAVFATGPALSNPTVTTQSATDNSTKAASTAFYQEQAGNLPAQASTGSAASGKVGEYLVATSTPSSATSGAAANITSFTATPGDWDFRGVVCASSVTTGMTGLIASISTVSNTVQGFGTLQYNQIILANGSTIMGQTCMTVGPARLTFSTNTQVYLVGNAAFAGTLSLSGQIASRRPE